MAISPELTLASPDSAPISADRIRLLEAIGREGSITAAARAVGVSYKTAWDAVAAMNNLVGRPLVIGRPGGRSGGGAVLTPDGSRLIAAFRRLQEEMARSFARIDADLGGTGLTTTHILWSLNMRTSARNALAGTVTEITDGAVNAEVKLKISDAVTLAAIITRESVKELELVVGTPATALIKAPFVILASADTTQKTSVRNRIQGTVAKIETGAVNAEVVLDIGGGKTLTSIITMEALSDLGFELGKPAVALIKAPFIILAVD
ncbi:MAG: TOBE domain-containing protein [Mangrovicoccus sp.]|nr:TOBE domain-containing protein [Mangrovicoccus sp.]